MSGESPLLGGRGATAIVGIGLVVIGVGVMFTTKEFWAGLGLTIFGGFLIWYANR